MHKDRPVNIDRLDHLVLTVADIEVTAAFYETVLGMRRIAFGDNRVALVFGEQKINLHPVRAPLQPHASRPTPGSADLCLITDDSLAQVQSHLERCGVTIIEGPVMRTGATGPIESVYCNDPDGNLIEVSRYR